MRRETAADADRSCSWIGTAHAPLATVLWICRFCGTCVNQAGEGLDFKRD